LPEKLKLKAPDEWSSDQREIHTVTKQAKTLSKLSILFHPVAFTDEAVLLSIFFHFRLKQKR